MTNKKIYEIGEITSIMSLNTLEIRFRRGSFLIDVDKLDKI